MMMETILLRATASFLPTSIMRRLEAEDITRRCLIPGRFIRTRSTTLRKVLRTHVPSAATTVGLFLARQPHRCSPLPTAKVCMVTSRSLPRTAQFMCLTPDAAAACRFTRRVQDKRSSFLKTTELRGVSCRFPRSEEHTSELQSLAYLVCRPL